MKSDKEFLPPGPPLFERRQDLGSKIAEISGHIGEQYGGIKV